MLYYFHIRKERTEGTQAPSVRSYKSERVEQRGAIHMLYSLDRFEEDHALCEPLEGGETLCVLRAALPPQVRAGDLLRLVDGAWQVDAQATAERRARLAARYKRLREGEPS